MLENLHLNPQQTCDELKQKNLKYQLKLKLKPFLNNQKWGFVLKLLKLDL